MRDYTKRNIDKLTTIEQKELLIGKYVSAEIVSNIWNSHINELIKNQKWPIQCKDINKYLLEIDLAKSNYDLIIQDYEDLINSTF